MKFISVYFLFSHFLLAFIPLLTLCQLSVINFRRTHAVPVQPSSQTYASLNPRVPELSCFLCIHWYTRHKHNFMFLQIVYYTHSAT